MSGIIQDVVGPIVNTGSFSGTLALSTKKVRGQSLFGFDTTPDAVTGVEIRYNWRLGSDSGKGLLVSNDEHNLAGTWGNGSSETDRGIIHLTKP
ncbi:hypothetical protein [Grimontia marina]|uniref:Uncharacterized protein n=1 Tax=Grimontia marina TaxID=646534 RepID=A0A128FHN5_9GAMM|nr:hypothetical protein [Grimontia marina]CZF86015.1 hypothetical protein GMA8713_04048 [Grimontia marina]